MSFSLKRNHYDSLGVDPGATDSEIQKAYERSKRLLSGGSDAVYSLYSDEERRERLEAIEDAHRTLSDRALKLEYDKALAQTANADGTYEVDLGYIFQGRADEAHLQNPAVIETREYAKTTFTKHPVALDKSEAVANEQFKLLGSKLELLSKNAGLKTVAFTSAVKGEGKSSVSLNTAFVLASAFDKKVLFAECDLRKPSSACEHIAADGPGLADVLRGEAQLDEAIREIDGTGLFVLYSGSYDRNSADLIGSSNMTSVINSLRQRFEFVILDCPPVIPLADMSIIEKLVDGIVLVVKAGETSKDLVKNASESLDRKKFIGAVLNGAETKLERYYY